MGLFIFAVVIFLATIRISALMKQSSKSDYSDIEPQHIRIARVIGYSLAGILFFLSTITIIPAGEAGGKVLFGNVQDEVLGEGLHFVNPLLDIVKFDVKTQTYSMTSTEDMQEETYSSTDRDDAMDVLSADNLKLSVEVSVLYSVDKTMIPEILRTLGVDYKEKLIRPYTRSAMREVSARYIATDLISSKRGEFAMKVQDYLTQGLSVKGVTVEQVSVRNIELPPSVQQSIEQKIQAKQDAERMQFVLEKEQREAERKVIEAEGRANYIRIVTVSLNPQYLAYKKLEAMESISNSQNAKVIFWGGNAPMTFTNGF